jgi:hypothetical protein
MQRFFHIKSIKNIRSTIEDKIFKSLKELAFVGATMARTEPLGSATIEHGCVPMDSEV